MANPSFAHFVYYAGDSATAMLVAGSARTLLQRFSQQSPVALIPIDAPHVLGHPDAHVADRQDSASIAAAVALSGEIAAELASSVLQPDLHPSQIIRDMSVPWGMTRTFRPQLMLKSTNDRNRKRKVGTTKLRAERSTTTEETSQSPRNGNEAFQPSPEPAQRGSSILFSPGAT